MIIFANPVNLQVKLISKYASKLFSNLYITVKRQNKTAVVKKKIK